MTTISYRPELENPPREASVAFSYMDEKKNSFQTVTLVPGVNRRIDDNTWNVLKEQPTIKSLLRIKAIEVLESSKDSGLVNEGTPPELADVVGMAVADAFKVIESSFDEAFLSSWKREDRRATVVNKINQRLSRIKAGEG